MKRKSLLYVIEKYVGPDVADPWWPCLSVSSYHLEHTGALVNLKMFRDANPRGRYRVAVYERREKPTTGEKQT